MNCKNKAASDLNKTLIKLKLSNMENSYSQSIDQLPVFVLPPEIWRFIFSCLPFDDQKNCRQVCKDWLDVIMTLPKFKNNLHVNLKYALLSENYPPVKTILNSELKIRSLTIEKLWDLTLFPTLTPFLAHIGETITYLDIGQNTFFILQVDVVQLIAENFGLFKVLHHFKIDSFTTWTTVAATSIPPVCDNYIRSVLGTFTKMIKDGIPIAKVEQIYDEVINKKPGKVFLTRYKKIILESLEENPVEKLIFDSAKIKNEILVDIKKASNSLDISSRINPSVKIISFAEEKRHITDEDVKHMLKLVPNLQEINIKSTFSVKKLDLDTNYCNYHEILMAVPEKVKTIEVQSEYGYIGRIRDLNLFNLNHLNFNSDYSNNWYQLADDYIDLYPSIKSISVSTHSMPKSHLDYITELEIKQKKDKKINLNDLAAFKTLNSLTVTLNQNESVNEEELKDFCFFRHQPLVLNNIEKLNFNINQGLSCFECTVAFLQSLPNLRELKLSDNKNGQFVDRVFKHLPSLEKFRIKHRKFITVFKKNME